MQTTLSPARGAFSRLILRCLHTSILILTAVFAAQKAAASSHFFDFNSGIPAGSTTVGRGGMPQWTATGGVANSGVFRLSNAGTQQGGQFTLPVLDPGLSISGFEIRMKVLIGGGSSTPADGLLLGFSSDPLNWSDLTVDFDTYNNGGTDAISVDVLLNSVRIGRVPFQASQGPNGSSFLNLIVNLDTDGTLDVTYNGQALFADLPTGFTPGPNKRFWFAGGTGDRYDKHWIDDIGITTIPSYQPPFFSVAPTDQEALQNSPVLLSSVVNGSGTLTYQWKKDGLSIPGANTPNYSLSNAQPWHAGLYSLYVTNGTDSASAEATVSVTPFPMNVWQGLVAYYPLNAVQPGQDYGLFSNHAADAGTASSSDTWGRPDVTRRFVAAESDGMTAPANPAYHTGQPFTWSAWVKTSGAYGSATTRILSIEGPDGSSARGFALYANSNGKFGAGLNWGGGAESFESTLAYPANVWRQLAAVYDGSRLRLYVDGIQAGSRLYAGITLTSSAPLSFGKYRAVTDGTDAAYFDGWIDDVRFYNRALTATDLIQLRASDDAVDADNDGLGDAWEAKYGFNSSQNEAGADLDGDGMTNLQEYRSGSNPTNAASNFFAPALSEVAGLNVLNLTWHGSASRNYAIRMSPDLVTWDTLTSVIGQNTPMSFVVESPLRPSRHFYRVDVVP